MPRTASSTRRSRAARSTRKSRSRAHRPGSPAISLAARRHPLVAEIDRQLHRLGVFPPSMDEAQAADGLEQPLVLGVSGGADSVALLLACAVLAQRSKNNGHVRLIPIAVHVHHHLRASAGADASWVQKLCQKLGIECVVEHVRPGELNGNVSANARMLRYEVLARSARRFGAAHVAVAHHGEDQLETVLI